MKKKIIGLIIGFVLILILLVLLLFYNNKTYTDADFNIKTYHSKIDFDNDGIDDQQDILENVKKYIKTKPKYKSKYYQGGYPNDGYGVCTDVVAFGLRDAGYDLRELVNKDINTRPEAYNVDIIDKDIDFRRVRNLLVYFQHNAINLSLDIYDISVWQAGDIVIFNNHVGIISNKRNRKGIPFVIHHYGTLQVSYEEDILEKRNDIVGHFRIS